MNIEINYDGSVATCKINGKDIKNCKPTDIAIATTAMILIVESI